MGNTDGVSDPFVIDDTIGTAIGNAPSVGADQPPADSSVGQVRGPRSARRRAGKMIPAIVVAFEDQLSIFWLQAIEIVQRSPVDLAQHE